MMKGLSRARCCMPSSIYKLRTILKASSAGEMPLLKLNPQVNTIYIQ